MDIPEIISLTNHELQEVTRMAAANYSPSDIATYLGKPKRMFKTALTAKHTILYEAYHRGRLEIRADIDLKIVEKALEGSQTAIQIHQNNYEALEFENIKSKFFDL